MLLKVDWMVPKCHITLITMVGLALSKYFWRSLFRDWIEALQRASNIQILCGLYIFTFFRPELNPKVFLNCWGLTQSLLSRLYGTLEPFNQPWVAHFSHSVMLKQARPLYWSFFHLSGPLRALPLDRKSPKWYWSFLHPCTERYEPAESLE